MKRTLALALATAILPAFAGAPVVANYDQVDTSRWRCRLCPFDLATAARGRVAGGAVDVRDAEARFGRDNGLGEAGAHADVNASFARRDDRGRHALVEGVDLGLDSRYAEVRTGRHGRYDIAFGWQEIPRLVSTDGVTPDGRHFDNATHREKQAASVTIDATRRLRLQGAYRREAKTGARETYADFLYQATGLAKPVDQTTEELGGQAVFNSRPLLVAAEVTRSRFCNAHRSLEWENVSGAQRTGRLALAPDNVADAASLHSRATLGRTRFSTRLTWGRQRQNDAFLPYTANTRLALDPLPRAGLDGRVDTFAGVARLVSQVTDRLRLSLGHREQERDNATPALILTPVLGEAFATPPRPGRAYAWRKADTDAALRYRLAKRTFVAFGSRMREWERSPLEIAGNEERAFWVDLTARGANGLVFSLKAERSVRDAAAFQKTTRNNPLTRRYYQAARDRQLWRSSIDYHIAALNLSLGAEVDLTDTAYPDSRLGVQDERDRGFALDLAYAPTADLSLSAFVSSREADATTAGSDPFSTPDWRYGTADDVATAGFAADARGLLHPKLDLSLTFNQSLGRGRYETVVSDAALTFPDLVSDHRSLEVEATYRWRDRTAFIARWYREDYAGADWGLDGVAPDTIRSVLAFGRQPPVYTNSLLAFRIERRL